MQHTWFVVPDIDSHVTYSTDIDSHMTCSNKYDFLWTVHSCKASPLTPLHSCELDLCYLLVIITSYQSLIF